jgi:hypothetical protein
MIGLIETTLCLMVPPYLLGTINFGPAVIVLHDHAASFGSNCFC